MKYIWTSKELGTMFKTEEYNATHLKVTYPHENTTSLMRKAWLTEDIRTGTIAVWNGVQYMRLRYGRWVIHLPQGCQPVDNPKDKII